VQLQERSQILVDLKKVTVNLLLKIGNIFLAFLSQRKNMNSSCSLRRTYWKQISSQIIVKLPEWAMIQNSISKRKELCEYQPMQLFIPQLLWHVRICNLSMLNCVDFYCITSLREGVKKSRICKIPSPFLSG
jgi:hypothetical protein